MGNLEQDLGPEVVVVGMTELTDQKVKTAEVSKLGSGFIGGPFSMSCEA